MPRKKINKIGKAAVSVLFALCVGFFAVLPQTSAWFYDKFEDEKTFTFGILSVQQDYLGFDALDLPAATKVEDPGEIRFDEALHIVEIEAVNDGTLPARVYVTIEPDAANPYSLRYFYYEDGDEGATVIEKIRNFGLVTDNVPGATYDALNLYHIGDGVNNNYGRYIVVPPATTKTLKIAFWADYNEVGGALENNADVDVHAEYYVEFTLHAVQNTDGAFTRT